MKHFLSIADTDAAGLTALLDTAAAMKAARTVSSDLAGKTVALIFEKPSTRTRISFQVAVTELGGFALPLAAAELQLGRGETIEDTGRVLSRYVHGVVVRTFGQDRLERLAASGSIPVVNALSDLEHPCQALADLLTVRERFGALAGKRLAYIGDGNNVAHSLLLGGALGGMEIAVATPAGYEPDAAIVSQAEVLAAKHGGSIEVTLDPHAAVKGADAVYTDVWASMGQEDEAEARKAVFAPFQVNDALLDAAPAHAIVLHCLPAHRGEEISAEVLDGDRSAVWDQAENRLHVQKALLAHLMGGRR